MKIDINNAYSSLSNKAIVRQKSLVVYSGASAAQEPVNPEKKDTVTLSGAARLADRSSRTYDTAAVFDAHRVAELRNTIHTGNYVINPVRVAEKLHQFTLELP
ncbi:MAG: flagellar biosynthesis anti-sigma factor FlgM [Gammaproteobacteria bacterium]|jgi:flagellar biosynthesis anti-sigma factor FlgM